jgi:polyisoprenoid-binding protein YceI
MKSVKFLLVSLALAFGSMGSASAAVETYEIDPVHTWVGFNATHFFTKVPGYFASVKGTVVVDRDHLENSTVEAIIGTASITTNTPMRDEDLRSNRFFDAATFPNMTFKSKRWKRTGDHTFAVTGDLTIKNVTKEVVLAVTSTGFGPGMKGAAISGWEVSTTLNRQDYGVSADKDSIADAIEITIHVEADLRKQPAPPSHE